MATTEHKQRMERRGYLLRKRHPRFHVTAIYQDENRVMVKQSNDLDSLRSIANKHAPAYIVDNHARPTPEVVYVALKEESPVVAQHYMEACK